MRDTSKTAPEGAAAASAAGVAEAGILAEITAGLASGDNLNALLGRFLEPIVHIAGAHAGAVRVLSDDGRSMQLLASLGLPGRVAAAERAVEGDCGACGLAVLGDRPVWTEDMSICAQRSEGAFFGTGCQRVLAMPLHHRARVLGVYNLFFDCRPEPAPAVLAVLRSVGDLLGLALDNARLERENLQSVVLRERQAMAADVHDSLGQQLTYVKMRLPLLHDALRRCDQAQAQRYFDDVREAVGQAHGSLRGILAHFRSGALPQGLEQALSDAAGAFRSSGIGLEIENHLSDKTLTAEQEVQVYHIVQEALTNIMRHAAARHARVQLGLHAPGQVQVSIEDDGSGLPAGAGRDGPGSHYGLAVMRERAVRLGGSLEIGARPGGGTRVRLFFPLQPECRMGEGVH